MNLLKAPLNHIPPTTVISILSGPLRGKRWVVGASRHAYWLGLYEKEKMRHFARRVQPGQVVFDVGAHVGYYALLAATRVGPTGHVWAFEPVPENFAYLQQHIALNHLSNLTCLQMAVADVSGTTLFRKGGTRSTGSLSSDGELTVTTISLDDLVERSQAPTPHIIKLDVEGAELAALAGARKLLLRAHPKIYVATHSVTLHRDCAMLLEEMNYRVTVLECDATERRGELFAE